MKRLLAAALFAAALPLSLAVPAAAQSQRTYSLRNGGTITPASPGLDPTGAPAYIGGQVAGQVDGGTFSLWVSFRNTGCAQGAVCSGEIVPQYSSFAVTEGSGRKSVTTSGSIDSGTVTYRLTAEGMAEIVSVTPNPAEPNNLTVWEGKNKRRTRVGYGTLDYGTSAAGAGTIVLNFF